jgi:preprotein translocase subunit SecY
MNLLKLKDAIVITSFYLIAVVSTIALFVGVPVYLGKQFGIDAPLIYMAMVMFICAVSLVYCQIDENNYTIVAKEVKKNGKKPKNR